MTQDIRTQFIAALLEVAPDIDGATLDDEVDLFDEYDLDSMDLLSLVDGVSERLGVDVPERDYGELRTVQSAVSYLSERRAPSTS